MQARVGGHGHLNSYHVHLLLTNLGDTVSTSTTTTMTTITSGTTINSTTMMIIIIIFSIIVVFLLVVVMTCSVVFIATKFSVGKLEETTDEGIKIENNEAYGIVGDGGIEIENNKAYGIVGDGGIEIENNEAYGIVREARGEGGETTYEIMVSNESIYEEITI